MICSKCGGIIGDGLSECKACGARVELSDKALDQVIVKELDSGSLVYFRPSKTDIESLDVSELSELYSSNEILSALKSLYIEPSDEERPLGDPDTRYEEPEDESSDEKIRLYSSERDIDFSDDEDTSDRDAKSRKLIFKYVTSARTKTFDGNTGLPEKTEPSGKKSPGDSGVSPVAFSPDGNARLGKESETRDLECEPTMSDIPSDEEDCPEFDLEFKPTLYNGDYKDGDGAAVSGREGCASRGDDSISAPGWMGIFLLLLIPGINLLLLIIWAFGGCRKKQKTSFARGILFLLIIAAIIGALFTTVFKDFLPPVLEALSRAFAAASGFADYVIKPIRGIIK